MKGCTGAVDVRKKGPVEKNRQVARACVGNATGITATGAQSALQCTSGGQESGRGACNAWVLACLMSDAMKAHARNGVGNAGGARDAKGTFVARA
jgi:hypothetical protein